MQYIHLRLGAGGNKAYLDGKMNYELPCTESWPSDIFLTRTSLILSVYHPSQPPDQPSMGQAIISARRSCRPSSSRARRGITSRTIILVLIHSPTSRWRDSPISMLDTRGSWCWMYLLSPSPSLINTLTLSLLVSGRALDNWRRTQVVL